MKAKAAVFMGENLPFEVREFDITKTPLGYGRSRLIASGICGTDIHIHNGKLSVQPPTVIGHEFVGKLAVPCGECLLCKSGDDANCVNMQETNGGSIDEPPYLYGGYAEVNYTPLSNLIKISDELDPEMVAVFACPSPTVMHTINLAKQAGVDFSRIKAAAVQGLGPVGCYAVM